MDNVALSILLDHLNYWLPKSVTVLADINEFWALTGGDYCLLLNWDIVLTWDTVSDKVTKYALALRNDHRSIKELRQTLPDNFDWHIATGFNQCGSAGQIRPETTVSHTLNEGQGQSHSIRESEISVSAENDAPHTSHDDTMSSSITLREGNYCPYLSMAIKDNNWT